MIILYYRICFEEGKMELNHFTATGIVFNKNKQILMIFHKKLNVWLPPGGHIEDNELPTNAVIREIFEETGIKVEIFPIENKILTLSNNDCKELEKPFVLLLENIEGNWKHNHIDMVFICKALNENFKLQKTEVNDIGWFDIDHVKQLKTFENVKQSIEKAFEIINKI